MTRQNKKLYQELGLESLRIWIGISLQFDYFQTLIIPTCNANNNPLKNTKRNFKKLFVPSPILALILVLENLRDFRIFKTNVLKFIETSSKFI